MMQQVQNNCRLVHLLALAALSCAMIQPAYAQQQMPTAPANAAKSSNAANNPGGQTNAPPPVCAGTGQMENDSDLSDQVVIEATTMGLRVALNPDGSWALVPPVGVDVIDAVTDTGQSIGLTRQTEPSGCIDQKWQAIGASGGLIHVFITRAIDTKNSAHSNRDNCIPVVSALNLNRQSLGEMLVEIEFSSPSGATTGTTMMFDALDKGEEKNITGASLFVPGCEGLTGVLRVSHCTLTNGTPCTALVTASDRGIIPLVLDGGT